MKAFEIENFVNTNKDNANMIFDLWFSFLRDILVIQCEAYDYVINSDKISQLRQLVQRCDIKKTVNAMEQIISAKNMLRRFISPKAAALRCGLKS